MPFLDTERIPFPPLVPVSSLAPGCPFHQTLLCPLSFYQSSLPPLLLSKQKIEYRQVLEQLPRGRATLSDSTERALRHTPCKKISLSFCLSLSQRKSCREGATFFSFLFPRGLCTTCAVGELRAIVGGNFLFFQRWLLDFRPSPRSRPLLFCPLLGLGPRSFFCCFRSLGCAGRFQSISLFLSSSAYIDRRGNL